jgi:hypothetical protein
MAIPRQGLVALAALAALLLAVVPASAAESNAYTVHPLVSDEGGNGVFADTNLVNAWGLVAGPATPWWISDNGTDTSTLYNVPTGSIPFEVGVDGAPTGVVFHNATADPSNFVLPSGGSARFIFATESGVIRGWNGGPTAQLGVDRSDVDDVYKASRSLTPRAGRGSMRPTSTTSGWTCSTAPGASSQTRGSWIPPCPTTTGRSAFRPSARESS